jgi:hypothetical protein
MILDDHHGADKSSLASRPWQIGHASRRCRVSLVNRHFEVSRAACVPASLTRILTLGVYQWCPSHVSWKADVTNPGPQSVVLPSS